MRISALPYGDDNNDIYSNDDYEDDSEAAGGQKESQIYSVPQFVSDPQSDLVNEGATIRLKCIVDRLGKSAVFCVRKSGGVRFRDFAAR